jgi:hypothetical protein
MVLEPPNADTVIQTTNKQPSHLGLGHLNVNFNFRANQLFHESLQFEARVAPCLFGNVKVPCQHTRVVTTFTFLYQRFIRVYAMGRGFPMVIFTVDAKNSIRR